MINMRGIVLITMCLAAVSSLTAAADLPPATDDCISCHPVQAGIMSGEMATRSGERAFACRAFGNEGESFFQASCAGCHVSTCNDCHGPDAHATPMSFDNACLGCHSGYFTGWDYYGRAPREDHERYQRGPSAQEEYYLTMLQDVHRDAGLGCTDCHRIHAGDGGVKTCRDCHADLDRSIPEHAITAHLDRMTCSTCHAAWAAQEYGTVLVRAVTEDQLDAFDPLPWAGSWQKSAALRRQGAPPLGLNASGLVSPIRPQFILLATDPQRGWENRLLTAEWRAFSPHTIRRGAVACGGCHDNERRFVLEKPEDRIYDLKADGLTLESWWNQAGQRVVNGAFFTRERFDHMNTRTPEYVRQHLRRWKSLLYPDAGSSSH